MRVRSETFGLCMQRGFSVGPKSDADLVGPRDGCPLLQLAGLRVNPLDGERAGTTSIYHRSFPLVPRGSSRYSGDSPAAPWLPGRSAGPGRNGASGVLERSRCYARWMALRVDTCMATSKGRSRITRRDGWTSIRHSYPLSDVGLLPLVCACTQAPVRGVAPGAGNPASAWSRTRTQS